jgi:large subunit ribosomal protein L21
VYAIVRAGGKQYRVQQGDTIHVDRIAAAPGEKITLSEVLLVGGDETRLGQPAVDKAAVVAEVVAQGRDHKIRVFKYKKRKHYRRTRGHRQAYTVLRIEAIQV